VSLCGPCHERAHVPADGSRRRRGLGSWRG
jgi:hypothetical protein